MALEEELMTADKEQAAKEVKEEAPKNFDDLTDEEIDAVKELSLSEWWKILLKCMKKRVEKQEKDLIVLAKDNCFNPKVDGYTYYEILGAFLQGMWEMERLVNVVTADPEEIRKAQEAVQKAEAMLRGEKVDEEKQE